MDSLGFEVERMEIEQLFQVGDTFDIILFKNRTVMSKVQRLLTNSDYDHVAMLIKTSSGELYILESSSNMGVSVYSLKSLINLPRKKYYFRYKNSYSGLAFEGSWEAVILRSYIVCRTSCGRQWVRNTSSILCI